MKQLTRSEFNKQGTTYKSVTSPATDEQVTQITDIVENNGNLAYSVDGSNFKTITNEIQKVDDVSEIYPSANALPILGASDDGVVYGALTNGELPLKLYKYSASDSSWEYIDQAKDNVLYLDGETGLIYEFKSASPYFFVTSYTKMSQLTNDASYINQSAMNTAISSAVASETTARESADTTLQNNITAEATTRANADTALRQDLDAEQLARSTADTDLQTAITTEIGNRQSADTTLQNNITAETTARENADTTLQENITAEVTARTDADTALQNLITGLENSKQDTLTAGTNITIENNVISAQGVTEITDTSIRIYGYTPGIYKVNVTGSFTILYNGSSGSDTLSIPFRASNVCALMISLNNDPAAGAVYTWMLISSREAYIGSTTPSSGTYTGLQKKMTAGSNVTITNDTISVTLPTIDSALSTTSTNAVQNAVVTTALNGKQASLSSDQLNAVNSGITSSLVTQIGTNANDITAEATARENADTTLQTNINAKYTKPSGGIPKTDLASAVQTSLGKADTALQSISSSDVTTALGFTPYNSTNPSGYTKVEASNTNGNIKINGSETSVYTLPSDIATDSDVSAVQSNLNDEITAREGVDTALQNSIKTINGKIPTQASSSNKLADMSFVNSSINAFAAYYITKNAAGDPFATKAELNAATTFYSGGATRTPTTNDYCIVLADESKQSETGVDPTTRYSYQGNQWEYQYTVNDTPLTAAQLAAINSGATSTNIAQISTNASNITDLQNNKQDNLTTAQLNAVNSGITSTLVTQIGTNTTNISTKQDALNTAQLNAVNSGITSALVTQIGTNTTNITNLGEEKQDAITSTNKLDADLVDDETSTNKFVTSAEKTTWNNKQNALTFDSAPTQNSTKPVTSGGVYTALTGKQDKITSTNKLDYSLLSNTPTIPTTTSSVTSGSTAALTSGGAYTALAGKQDKITSTNKLDYSLIDNTPTIPSGVTSINGLSGGSLTSPLVITGGDAATAPKIALDQTASGQITNNGTQTLFGFTSNNASSLTIGHSSYAMALRGSGTRPTYNGNSVALSSDVPATTSSVTSGSTAALTSGGAYTALAGKQNTLTFDTTPTSGSTKPVTSGGVYTALSGKQNKLTFDTTPTSSSTRPVTSGGVYTALSGKQNTLTFDSTPKQNSTNPVTSGGVHTALAGKQNTLTAGENITIENNVISATGGGSASQTKYHTLKTDFSGKWLSKTWTGLTSFNGSYVWSDGINIYYSYGSTQYVLDVATSTWNKKTWSGLTNFYGNAIWTDGTNIYYSNGSSQYVLDVATSTWSAKTWSGLTSFTGQNVWTDGTNYYCSNGSNQYVLDISTSTWTAKTWTGLTSFNGFNVWSDGINIYYSQSSNQYVLDVATSVWSAKTWTGSTSFSANDGIWTDGTNIYFSTSGFNQYVLNIETSTWSTKKWSGVTSIVRGQYIWTDGTNTYYSYSSDHYVLGTIVSTKTKLK